MRLVSIRQTIMIIDHAFHIFDIAYQSERRIKMPRMKYGYLLLMGPLHNIIMLILTTTHLLIFVLLVEVNITDKACHA